jgi:hypothetical protein
MKTKMTKGGSPEVRVAFLTIQGSNLSFPNGMIWLCPTPKAEMSMNWGGTAPTRTLA